MQSIWTYKPSSEVFVDLEELWAGGVADLGDKRSAQAIEHLPGYNRYQKDVQDRVRKELGDAFTLYRAMPRSQLKEWREDIGSIHDFFAFTIDPKVAKAWQGLAAHSGKKLIIAAVPLTPESVVMRGKKGEAELVVYSGYIIPSLIKVLR